VKWRGACLITRVSYSRLATPLAVVLFATSFIGCKTSQVARRLTAPVGKLYAVSNDSTGFFRHGPQTGRDPDQRLTKDTIVKLIRPSFGFSKIELVSSGETGYILTDDIRPASPALIAATTVATEDAPVSHTFGSPRETFNINSDDPRLVPPPEQLPAPDLPPQDTPPAE